MIKTACRCTVLFGLFTFLVTAVSAQDVAKPRRPPIPYAAIQEFTDVFERVRADAVTSMDGDAMMVAAMKGMLQRVDPEGGEYWTKDEYREFRAGGDQHDVGIGLEIRLRQGQLTVFPIDGGPAAAAGLRGGDVLRTIGGAAVTGLTPQQAARLLSGEAGSQVVLGVVRADSGSVREVAVERRQVPWPAVAVSRKDADVAVLRVPPFQWNTLRQVADALNQEWKRRPFKGLVIDLRHNVGGLLESSVGLAAAFLKPEDLVVKTTGRIREANQEFHATPSDYTRSGEPDPLASLSPVLRGLPLVILVDDSTASGAEIVAAALRDHGRAILVGHTTYGRGSIQTVMPMASGGAIKLTTAYYVTPSGLQLQGRGLQPDVAVSSDDEAMALEQAVAALRKRL